MESEAIDFLGSLITSASSRSLSPETLSCLREIQSSYSHKLWHPMTQQLKHLFSHPDARAILRDVFDGVVLKVADTMQPVAFVHLACLVSETLGPFLGPISEMPLVSRDPAALSLALTRTWLEELQVPSQKDDPDVIKKAKETLKKSDSLLQGMAGLDYSIHASHWLLACLLSKATGDKDSFYRNSLNYLGVIPPSSMAMEERAKWASELSMAALTGPSIFFFGDLINSWVFGSVLSSTLGKLVASMESGMASESLRLLSTCPELQPFSETVTGKIHLTSICHLLFEKSFSGAERSISFSELSQVSTLPFDHVELAMMKLLSLGLARGSIDQPLSVFKFTWVHSRSLTLDQTKHLLARFNTWSGRVQMALRELAARIS